ncbi:hypothetical protein GGR57DRAFT_264893 [Xylariaceae sp. FL1272]|nr:hypothetical protein GGR57DRAFT_264893 [Xylariaceae sp. FL1272]
MQFTKFALAALSFGSAIAAPAAKREVLGESEVALLGGALSVVGNVQAVLAKETSTITGLISLDTLPADAIGTVKVSLTTVGQTVNQLLSEVSALSDVTDTLSETDITDLKKVLTETKTIVGDVKSLATSIVKDVAQDVLSEVNPLLQFVLATTGAVTTPLISFVETAVPATSPVFNEVQALVGEVEGVANGLLAPVNTILGGLLA